MKIAFCTIASANYLSRVQVLEKSLRRFHPEAELQILLCERPEVCSDISTKTGRKLYSPADVGCEDWLQMAFYYDITEYNTALKPFFMEQLLREGFEGVLYFDPDIEIYGSLDELLSLVTAHDVILTPHATKPVPSDGKNPSMDSYIRAGQFNLGFVGVRGSDEVVDLLRWWQSVLLEKCIFETDHHFFVDQFWAAAFPSFIDNTYILRNPAYNMAYWNVFQRTLENVNGSWQTDSGTLKFFHFSGLHRKDLTKVSVHQDRVTAPVGSPLYQLLDEYFARIKKQEWSRFDTCLYSFARYQGGEPITSEERRAFLSMSRDERHEAGDPFMDSSTGKDAIRRRCQADLSGGKGFGVDRAAVLYKKIETLEKQNRQLLDSLSWKVTAPLRKLHSFFTG